ncbi:hypothetical protein BKA82DRAFT_207543 [Pisolithus tinctorius]|uniref:Secreted protein n=1 Tax=Pisolithus tinctorius Marx 270 TaxID=870435 RepID=A0A0C3PZA9_PISTI|nr:hypothetical protein BKA82DRAFT_207543 [Pisolithus tinctorius]KIO15176.1 hypothetical protein M404DRAFT_207543 [Pisolithus tinctorius Marx 270]
MPLPLPRLLLTVLAPSTCTSFVNFATFACEMKSTVRNAQWNGLIVGIHASSVAQHMRYPFYLPVQLPSLLYAFLFPMHRIEWGCFNEFPEAGLLSFNVLCESVTWNQNKRHGKGEVARCWRNGLHRG